MNKEELEAFTHQTAKGLKTEKGLNEFSQMPTKVALEAVLNAELDDHLGYSKHETSDANNSRNGPPARRYVPKTVSLNSTRVIGMAVTQF